MRYGSLCSGIESAGIALVEKLGWELQYVAEIDPHCCAVIERHHPGVPNLGDITKVDREAIKRLPPVDALVAGTPCQSFSVAGLRQGMDDPRGQLVLDFLRFVDEARPTWLLWENTPGVLSTQRGRGFGSLVGALEELGYGWAYRTLDAQYFGLAQRRKRVFLVGHTGGEWAAPAAVLLEPEGLLGVSAARGQAGAGDPGAAAGGARTPVAGVDLVQITSADNRSTVRTDAPAPPLCVSSDLYAIIGLDDKADPLVTKEGGTYTHEGSNNFRLRNVVPTYTIHADALSRDGEAHVAQPDANGLVRKRPPGFGLAQEDVAPTLGTGPVHAVAFSCKDDGGDLTSDKAPTMRAMNHSASHANGGGQLAVAFKPSHYTRDKDGKPSQVAPPLSADMDRGDQEPLVVTARTRGENPVLEAHAGPANALLNPGDGGRAHTQMVAVNMARGLAEHGTLELTPVSPTIAESEWRGQTYIVNTQGAEDARTDQAHAREVLRALRVEVGEEAFIEWCSGVLVSLQSPEVLRPSLYGESLRREADETRLGMDDGTLSRKEVDTHRPLFKVRQAGCERRTPQGWKLPKQLKRELDSSLSKLPSEGAQDSPFLFGMREASEGIGVLQQALHSIQGRQAPATDGWVIRRFTPIECERLQGVPDNWTNVPFVPRKRKKAVEATDTPRYRALGNAFAVNVIEWIGRRLEAVDDILKESPR